MVIKGQQRHCRCSSSFPHLVEAQLWLDEGAQPDVGAEEGEEVGGVLPHPPLAVAGGEHGRVPGVLHGHVANEVEGPAEKKWFFMRVCAPISLGIRVGVELGPSPKVRRLDTVFLSPSRHEPNFLKLIICEKSD